MALLASPLAFPLGGGGGGFPSGSFFGTTPLGAGAGFTGGGGNDVYFNPNYPINQGPYTYPTNMPTGLFLRWMPTPLVNGATVIDLVMPGGFNEMQLSYIVLYTYVSASGTIV